MKAACLQGGAEGSDERDTQDTGDVTDVSLVANLRRVALIEMNQQQEERTAGVVVGLDAT